jgi:hypothetical protein
MRTRQYAGKGGSMHLSAGIIGNAQPLTCRPFLYRLLTMRTATPDPVMKKAQSLFAKSGKSLDQLGREMGYKGEAARKSAWQFLHMTSDPRLSMLRRFAKAMEVRLKELLND